MKLKNFLLKTLAGILLLSGSSFLSIVPSTSVQAQSVCEITPQRIQADEWDFNYGQDTTDLPASSIGRDIISAQRDGCGSPGVIFNQVSNTDILTLYPAFGIPDDHNFTDKTYYSEASNFAYLIEVDNSSADQSSALIYDGRGDWSPTGLTISGDSNANPFIGDDQDQNGSLSIFLAISKFKELLETQSAGPFQAELRDEAGVLVGDPENFEEVPQGSDVPNHHVRFYFSPVPAGENYQVLIRQNGKLIAEEAGIEVRAGQDIRYTLSADQDDIEDDEISDRAIRSPCSGFGVGWILCKTIQGLLAGLNFMFEQVILPLLEVQPIQQLNDDGELSDSYRIWSSMRVVGNIAFIGIFLWLIIGVSTSWTLTNYEIKKLLPRIFIGIILAQLSWFLVAFVIDVGNLIGAGTRGLILSPIQNAAGPDIDVNNFIELTSPFWIVGGLSTAFTSAGGALGAIFLMVLMLIPAMVALAIVIFVLAARQVVLLLLVIVSPLVFILWVVPGGEKFVKQWWETFWKLIIMYPIIVGLIAAGELTSKILAASRPDSFWLQITALVSLLAPFFLIPATFKFAGSVLVNAASGFDGMRSNINERVFGSTDPFAHNRGGMLGRYRDFREQRAQQDQFRQTMANNSFIQSNREAAGIRPSGVRLRDLLSSKNNPGWRAMAKYGSYHLLAPKGGDLKGLRRLSAIGSTASRGILGAKNRLNPNIVDRRMSERTFAAKKWIDALSNNGNDDVIHAIFGDKNMLTGEQLPAYAITQAKEYRGDQAAANAALKYVVTQAVTGEQWQDVWNHYAAWNPYAMEVNKGVSSRDAKPIPGMKKRFDEFNTEKIGIMKGATFGTQRERKDGKNRDVFGKKHASYIEHRANVIWQRDGQAGVADEIMKEWHQHAKDNGINQPSIPLRQEDESDKDFAKREGKYKADIKDYNKKFDEFAKPRMAPKREEFIENFIEKNKDNYGAIGDGGLFGAIGEVTADMPYTGQQYASLFEMMSEASHRMEEVKQNRSKLEEFAAEEVKIDENRSLSKKQKANEKSLAKERIGLGNVDAINIKPNQTEAVRILKEIRGDDDLGYADYAEADLDTKVQVKLKKIDEWFDKTVKEINHSRNLAIDVLESSGSSRPDEADSSTGVVDEPGVDSARDQVGRTVWRENEIEELLDNFAVRTLGKLDGSNKTFRNWAKVRQEENSTPRTDPNRRALKEQREIIEKQATRELDAEKLSDRRTKEMIREIHKEQVKQVLDQAQPGSYMEQWQENMDFVIDSDWLIDGRGSKGRND